MNKPLVIIVISFLLVTVYSVYQFTQYHESVHAVNCRLHAGEPEVTINLLKGGSTKCITYDWSDMEVLEERRDFDLMNEVVGYHMMALNFTILACSAFIALSFLVTIQGVVND